MKIDGRALAHTILHELKQNVSAMDTVPTLAVIQVGDDPGSTSYIRQKQKKGETVGINVIHKHFPGAILQKQLVANIQQLNTDNQIHGIIVQRPLPAHITSGAVTSIISPEKDVDGFRPDSRFTPPVALAVLHLLQAILFNKTTIHHNNGTKSSISHYRNILLSKHIVIVGRGETAGRPIAQTFEKLGIPYTAISTNHIETVNGSSKTKQPYNHKAIKQLFRNADIIISCVGTGRVVGKENLKHGVIFIGVGISRDENGKLHGDYDENEIQDVVSFYTPTPGGVGPLTVAFLLQNTVRAACSR